MRNGQKIVAVLIARQGSSRLPGKALADVGGRSVIWRILDRLQRMNLFDELCLATTTLPVDAALLQEARSFGATAVAGSPEDVLDRLHHAARACGADAVVEVGGDCPLVDRDVTARALDIYFAENPDYVTNVEPQTFPDGVDIHVVRYSSLKLAAENALLSSQRRHPLAYFHGNKDRFKGINFTNDVNLSHLRWTMDYAEDLEFIREIFGRLGDKNPLFGMQDILALLKEHPELGRINEKWATPASTNGAPAYWFNATYTSDLLNDVLLLQERCAQLEKDLDFTQAADHYRSLEKIADELKQRAEHLAKNH